MRVAISIPVHEAPAVVADQCRNILGSTGDACIVLHVSANMPELADRAAGELSDLIRDGRVLLNPTRLKTHGHNVLESHVANFTHLEQIGHPFEYFCLDASNSLMIRRGLAEHVARFDAGLKVSRYDLAANTWHLPHVRADEQMLALMRVLGIPATGIVGSQVEGSFYRRSLLGEPIRMIREHYRDYALRAVPEGGSAAVDGVLSHEPDGADVRAAVRLLSLGPQDRVDQAAQDPIATRLRRHGARYRLAAGGQAQEMPRRRPRRVRRETRGADDGVARARSTSGV